MVRLLFVGVPLLELVLLVLLSDRIGLLAAVALVVATGVIGAWVVVRQGRAVWQAIRLRVASGQFPEAELAHGAMLLVAGALLVTPGVLTDAVGLLLLVPFVREFLRVRFLRRLWRAIV